MSDGFTQELLRKLFTADASNDQGDVNRPPSGIDHEAVRKISFFGIQRKVEPDDLESYHDHRRFYL